MTGRDRYRIQMFLDRILVGNDCWIWTGKTTEWDYGTFGTRMAHRVAWELFRGPIPAGLEMDHLCQRPRCVRPAHLEPVTPLENKRRVAERRRTCPQGHPYSADNTARAIKNNSRICRTCQRASGRRWYGKVNAERQAGVVFRYHDGHKRVEWVGPDGQRWQIRRVVPAGTPSPRKYEIAQDIDGVWVPVAWAPLQRAARQWLAGHVLAGAS